MRLWFNIFGVAILSLVCFFCGGYYAIDAKDRSVKQKQKDHQTARAMYGLVVFSKILDAVKEGRNEDVNKYIVTEMDLYAYEINNGNKHAISAFEENDIDMVCKKMDSLAVREKLDICKN